MVVFAVICEPVSTCNSLLTGKSTGNFAFLGLRSQFRCTKPLCCSDFLTKFPTQIISENILKNSEFSNGIGDFLLQNPQYAFDLNKQVC
jgi:hypothetical protein